jgi:prophage antirepressor-like protein
MLEYITEEVGRIRTEKINFIPYFYAADICRILGKGTWTGTYAQRYAGKEHIKQIKNGLKKANLVDLDGVMNLCEKAQAKTSNLLMGVANRIHYDVAYLEDSSSGTIYLPLFKGEQQDYENDAGDFKVFHHAIFGKIRATLIDDNMYFYSTDICRALGFKRYGSVYTNRYAGEENLKQIVSESMRGTRCINVISIAGVRNLCQRSKLSPDTISDFSNWLHNATKQEKKPDATDREKPEEAVKEPLEETAEGKVDALFEKAVENLKNKAEEEKAAVEEKQVVDSNFTTFQNAEFGEIRTEVIGGEPWFCLADVCRALELTAKGVKQRLSDEVISNYPIVDTLGRTQEALFVNEDGLYDVILESRKESARKFRKWVTGEVLPSIRKTGSYQKPLTPLEQIQVIAQGTVELAQKVEKLERNSTQLERSLNQLEHDMPLYGCEIDEVQQHVKRKGVQCLGGKDSEAYADGSIRSQVYKDIYSQLKREYGCVSTYKSIKRKYIADVHDFIDCYQLPTVLEEQITAANAQQRLF